MLYGEFPLGQDLSALNRILNLHKIPHRFTEEGGKQRLWLARPEDAEAVTQLIQNPNDQQSPPETNSAGGITQEIPVHIRELYRFDLKRHYLTLIMIFFGALGYLLVKLEWHDLYQRIVFVPFDYLVATSEYWRLLTPVFLHFSELHVIFNCIWIWEVGKRLEIFMGKRDYFLLFFCCAVLSNVMQFYFTGYIHFGGLSGVVYGFFGCIFMLAMRWPSPILRMPPALYGFMLLMLVVGFTGGLNVLVDGEIANWAHLGGLIAGGAFGFLYQSIVRREV